MRLSPRFISQLIPPYAVSFFPPFILYWQSYLKTKVLLSDNPKMFRLQVEEILKINKTKSTQSISYTNIFLNYLLILQRQLYTNK